MATIVKRIKITNFKGIDNIEMSFDRENTLWLIKADNEVGKSSILEAIVALLSGNFTGSDLLREGKEKGVIEGDISREDGIYHIKFSLTGGRPYLTITYPDGTKSDKYGDLRDLFGYVDIDVDEFVAWSESAEGRRKQVEIVKQLLPTETLVKLEDLKNQATEMEPHRTEAWNQVVLAEKNLKQIGEPSPEEKVKYATKMELGELATDYKAAVEEDTERQGYIKNLDTYKAELVAADLQITNYRETFGKTIKDKQAELPGIDTWETKEIARIKAEAQAKRDLCNTEIKNAQDGLATKEKKYADYVSEHKKFISDAETSLAVPAKYNLADLQTKLQEIETFNENVAHVKRYSDQETELAQGRKNYEHYMNSIQALLKERENIIKAQNLPVAGLTFDDEGLILNGLRFQRGQISTSQEYLVALGISIALNKKTPILRISRGESLGKNMKVLAEVMKEYGMTGFAEKMESGIDNIRVEMYEDGQVVPVGDYSTNMPVPEVEKPKKEPKPKKVKAGESAPETQETAIPEPDQTDSEGAASGFGIKPMF